MVGTVGKALADHGLGPLSREAESEVAGKTASETDVASHVSLWALNLPVLTLC